MSDVARKEVEGIQRWLPEERKGPMRWRLRMIKTTITSQGAIKWVKRVSRVSSDEQTVETGGKSDISNYALSKPHNTSNSRPPPHSTGLAGELSNGSEMEMRGRLKWPRTSQMAVLIYFKYQDEGSNP